MRERWNLLQQQKDIFMIEKVMDMFYMDTTNIGRGHPVHAILLNKHSKTVCIPVEDNQICFSKRQFAKNNVFG